MRMVFMGTPAFAVPVLSSLADAGHEILAVYTQPDRPAGRGKRLAPSPVKQHAAEHGWEVRQPRSLRRDEAQRDLASLQPEVIIVAAYGLFLPVLVLQLPLLGCLNVHPSLLPRYRGPSPVAAPILNGDEVTGATVIKLDKGMDTGPVIAAKETAIGPEENAQELTARLFEIGASLLVEVLPAWASGDRSGRAPGRVQGDSHEAAFPRGRRDRLVGRRGPDIETGPCLPPLAGIVHSLAR